MKVFAHFYLVNENFSPEYADAQHGGEESENNLKYFWEDELAIKNSIGRIEEIDSAVYVLQGSLPNGASFAYDVPNMTHLLLHGEDGTVTPLVFSKGIYHRYELDAHGEVMHVRVFFKDYEVFSNPIPGVYIAAASFPSELARV
jgi:hypothetical protein